MKVYLVGAGPGDPGLITVKGRQALERADCVLYDFLANERLLDYAPGVRRAHLRRQETRQTRDDPAGDQRPDGGTGAARMDRGAPQGRRSVYLRARRRRDRGSGRRRHSLRDRSRRHHPSRTGRVHGRSADASRSFLGGDVRDGARGGADRLEQDRNVRNRGAVHGHGEFCRDREGDDGAWTAW